MMIQKRIGSWLLRSQCLAIVGSTICPLCVLDCTSFFSVVDCAHFLQQNLDDFGRPESQGVHTLDKLSLLEKRRTGNICSSEYVQGYYPLSMDALMLTMCERCLDIIV